MKKVIKVNNYNISNLENLKTNRLGRTGFSYNLMHKTPPNIYQIDITNLKIKTMKQFFNEERCLNIVYSFLKDAPIGEANISERIYKLR